MSSNRQLFFKIEKLNTAEAVLEEKSVTINGGSIDVGSGGSRRKASFELLEPLPANWQMHKWKLYYGYRERTTDPIIYYPQGVFIPINPSEREVNSGFVTSFQGVDKTKLFADFQLDTPITFASGTTVRSIVQTVAGWFNETKLVLAQDLGTLGAAFSFEEGSTAEQLLNSLVSSFNAEWFYNPDGFLVARRRTDPANRPITHRLDNPASPYYISSERTISDDNYYNKVTLVGGKADTPIYRSTVQNTDAITAAGGRVVQRYFSRDAAVTQVQVNALAAYYLSNGVLLPATLKVESLVIPNLELDEIIQKDNKRYEVRGFNIPLGLGTQNIDAGEIL